MAVDLRACTSKIWTSKKTGSNLILERFLNTSEYKNNDRSDTMNFREAPQYVFTKQQSCTADAYAELTSTDVI